MSSVTNSIDNISSSESLNKDITIINESMILVEESVTSPHNSFSSLEDTVRSLTGDYDSPNESMRYVRFKKNFFIDFFRKILERLDSLDEKISNLEQDLN